MDDAELHEGAERLLEAARAYFKLMQARRLSGGTIWLTDKDGAMVVFTRGEYRERLLRNIETIYDEGRVHQFGVADSVGEQLNDG
jgi:hypothetical protein